MLIAVKQRGTRMADRAKSATGAAHAGNARPRHTGRHLVLLRHGSGCSAVASFHRAAGLRVGVSSDYERGVRDQKLAHGEGVLFEELGAALVHSDPDQLDSLGAGAGGDFETVEPERIVYATAAGRDPPAASSAPAVAGGAATWGLHVTRVASSRFTGRGVRVAVLDTGLDTQHPDFSGRAIVTQSFVTGSPIDDVNGHGTHCVGVAIGPAVPAQGPRYGVACGALPYVGKVVADDGSGGDGNILAGLDWALRSGCAVVSLSVGSPVAAEDAYSAIFEQLAQRALTAGMLIIAAAGNDSLRPGSIAPVNHPANCPSILAIAAVDEHMAVWSESCGGIAGNGGEVDLAAPGVAVPSAWPRPTLYQQESGTSAATPYVAGIAALLAEANPAARGAALRTLLLAAVSRLTLPTRDVGAGLVQAP
jgi:subtilisin